MNIHFELALLKTLNTKNFRTLSSFYICKISNYILSLLQFEL